MKVIVVLGHRLKDDGSIAGELYKRLNLGIELFNKFKADAIIFSGGMTNPSAGITEADVMKKYAIFRGVPQHKIILEERALDTIGNAIFAKETLEERFKELYIVTSCYHIHRASFIFKMVFGEKYNLNFHCAGEEKRRSEEKKLDQTKRFFKGMYPGDDIELKKRFLKHELYRGKHR
jgi:uncharacterized SAM-binding protein YcdF (DUF218 family)